MQNTSRDSYGMALFDLIFIVRWTPKNNDADNRLPRRLNGDTVMADGWTLILADYLVLQPARQVYQYI